MLSSLHKCLLSQFSLFKRAYILFYLFFLLYFSLYVYAYFQFQLCVPLYITPCYFTHFHKILTLETPQKLKIVEFPNNIDPGEVAHYEPPHQDLQCFLLVSGFSLNKMYI